MHLETDSTSIGFKANAVQADDLAISFLGAQDFDIKFDRKNEMAAFMKKVSLSKEKLCETKIFLNKDFLARNNEFGDIKYSTSEKAIVNNYNLKKGIITFLTNRGEVKLSVSDETIKVINNKGLNFK